jgi:cell division protein FtsQ
MRIPGRVRLTVVVLILGAAVWSGYLWARDFSLFRVHHVTISGVAGRDGPAIRRALRQTGLRMTTLHVRREEFEHAVDTFPSVRSVSVSADFPNRLRVKVNEYVPVAVLTAPDGRRVAVSGARTLLRAAGPKDKLPAVKVDAIPTSGALEDTKAGRLVNAVARAPGALRPLLERVYTTRQGIRIPLRKGPLLYFGDARRLAAKWAAAARVLADPAAKGARVVDVRLPERPVAGGFSPSAGSTGGGADNTQL